MALGLLVLVQSSLRKKGFDKVYKIKLLNVYQPGKIYQIIPSHPDFLTLEIKKIFTANNDNMKKE